MPIDLERFKGCMVLYQFIDGARVQAEDISRSSAYILIKKDFFRSHKIGHQIRISKVSFDEWVDGVSPTPRDL